MLTMNVQQQRSKLTQRRRCCGLVVYEYPVTPVRRNFAADDEFAFLRIETKRFELGRKFCVEDGFNHGAILTAADHLGRGLGSGKQTQRVDDDGFSSAGFAGEEIEAFFKMQFEF